MKEFVAALRELADTGERASPALVRIAADVIEEQARGIGSLRTEREQLRAVAEANEGIITERDAARAQLKRDRDTLSLQSSQTICTREGGCVCVISLDPGPCDYMR